MTFYSSLEQSIFYKNSKGDMTPRDNDEKESWLFRKTFFHFSFSSSFLIIFLVLWVSILPDYSCGTDSWNQGFGYTYLFLPYLDDFSKWSRQNVMQIFDKVTKGGKKMQKSSIALCFFVKHVSHSFILTCSIFVIIIKTLEKHSRRILI